MFVWRASGGVAALMGVLAMAPAALAGTITVGLGVGYDHDTIQGAISTAVSGDAIVIADGIYTGDGNRDIDFLGKDVTVRSFNGPTNCIIDAGGSAADHHRGFIFQNGETNAAVLEGLTIRNGYAAQGGGIYCEGSSPTIRHCNVVQNTAIDVAGGVRGFNTAMVFEDNLVARNTCPGGGGGMSLIFADTVVRGCRIIGNRVPDRELNGGGMIIWGGQVSVVDSLFAGNYTHGDGGGLWTGNADGVIARNVFVGNRADINGGAVDLHDEARQTFAENLVVDNYVPGPGGSPDYALGGGVRIHYSSPPVKRNIIVGNRANLTGGGVHAHNSQSVLQGNLIAGNWAGSWGGGGVSCFPVASGTTHLQIVDSTLADNRATRRGDGIRCQGNAQATIRNSILWGTAQQISTHIPLEVAFSDVQGGWTGTGNISADPRFVGGAGGNWLANGVYNPETFQTGLFGGPWTPGELVGLCLNPNVIQSRQFYVVANSATTVTVWGNAAIVGQWGVPYRFYDYHLSGGSPAIDAGMAAPASLDLDGNLRPFDVPGVDNNGPLPDFDMGAYEFGALPAVPGDANFDGDVNVHDLAVVAANWQRRHCWKDKGDFNGDLIVDVFDLAILANNYNWSAGGAPVPEPAMLAVMALGALTLIRRKR